MVPNCVKEVMGITEIAPAIAAGAALELLLVEQF